MILETYETHTDSTGKETRSARVCTAYGPALALLVAPNSAAPAWRATYCDTRAELDLRFALAVGRDLTPEQEALYAPIKAREDRQLQAIRDRIDESVRRG
jgi:hypothetical protein